MEKRPITVLSTKQQKKFIIESEAETLGQLKQDMITAGVDIDDMTFYEGLSKTELIANDTQLPINVMYKGEPTNNLAIYVTNPKRKIESGMDRKEIYKEIKEWGLEDIIKTKYGKSYTQVSNEELMSVINEVNTSSDNDEDSNASADCPVDYTDKTCIQCRIKHMAEELLHIYNELEDLNITKGNDDKSVYTDNELDDMFNFLQLVG